MSSIIIGILIIVTSVAVVIISSRAISKPITVLTNRMQEIADGDLSKEVLTVSSKDEVDQLIAATNQMNRL